jgi:predicted MPP superfamily phosphohydrolase
MFFLLIIPGMLLGDALLWWWSDRRLHALPRSTRVTVALRWFLSIFMSLQIAGYLYVLGSRFVGIRASLNGALLAQVYVWHLLILPITLAVWIVCSIVRGLSALSRRRQAAALTDNSADLVGPSRREVLLASAVAIPPLIATTSTLAAMSRIDSFRIRRMDVPLANLPRALDGMTIAHVSDVHVGRFTHRRVLGAIAEATNRLRADLVLLTGDLIDFSLSDLPDAIEMVRRIDPRSGLFTIEGNHDLFEGRERFDRGVRSAGIPLLLNESATVTVRGFDVQLLGIRWGDAGRGPTRHRGPNYEQHLSDTLPLMRRDREVFPILLAHHPHAFDSAADAGVPLILAGHTHGGQLMLTESLGAGPLMFKYWSGLYRRNNSALVVSNGVGNWFPLRINAPAEIVHITLRAM